MRFLRFISFHTKRHFSTVDPRDLNLISSSKCFEGEQRIYSHFSKILCSKMKFGIYLPPSACGVLVQAKCPVLYFLSGLSCTHENFIFKSGMQQYAAKYELAVVNPDTSPRNVLPGEEDRANFGSGASFYLDATVKPWSKHYKMYTYVTQELPQVINENFPVSPTETGISGHSMGGHGALICALKYAGKYKSVSAFAPVASIMQSPLGRISLNGYLGPDERDWESWDATRLANKYCGRKMDIMIDLGSADEYIKTNDLQVDKFLQASSKKENLNVIFNCRKGYDHGYLFVSTFIGEHFAHHAKLLKCKNLDEIKQCDTISS